MQEERLLASDDDSDGDDGYGKARSAAQEAVTQAFIHPTKWKPGQSGNPAGKKPGPNKLTKEIREIARTIVDDEAYRAKLRRRLASGKISPQMETLLWQYAYGRPPEKVEVTITDSAQMTDDELASRVETLFLELRRVLPAREHPDDVPTYALMQPEDETEKK